MIGRVGQRRIYNPEPYIGKVQSIPLTRKGIITRDQNEDHELYYVGLTKVDQLGPVISRNLLAHFGNPKRIFRSSFRELLMVPGIGGKIAGAIKSAGPLRQAEAELEYASRNRVKIHHIESKEYPTMLKQVHNAPVVLYQKGELDFNSKVNIAIVGTRKPSDYGRRTAEQLSRFFAQRGINVVSGLAYGVDGEVHEAAIQEHGLTTAVLGHGLKTIYPREHTNKAHAIVEDGSLLTEYGAEVGPDGRNFPMRNRIISGLCHATIVIEAAERGGALITAKLAFEQDRIVYAVPGDIFRETSKGCNWLIQQNMAKLLMSPEEVLNEICPMVEKSRKKTSDHGPVVTNEEQEIIHFLTEKGLRPDEIALLVKKEIALVQSILIGLEIRGIVRQGPGQRYSLR